ncbi:MAG: methylated-DNA--[protein]-cysteine S-methyltransferase [Woeseiaceae bacterium]|nr:methylated-DNA--[protein]-cysteine S-methyltransferase [Woeseiaceae bacterium]
MDRETRMRRIWETIADIPAGSVANYGQVAEIAGIPRGARQVAYALRHAPQGMELPWHRVIRSSGKSAFDPNSRAFRRQRDRLAHEGVVMLNGKVDMGKYRWEPDLDELLWKPGSAWDEE